jgi:uncharacterized LabA/DUF88 family protein
MEKLHAFCSRRGNQVSRPIYCLGQTPGIDTSKGNEGVLDVIEGTGFELVSRMCVDHPLKCSKCRCELGDCPYCSTPLRRLKGDFDADIAGEICRYVYSQQVNYVLLFATDGDFTRILDTVRRDRGVEIEIVGISPGYWSGASVCRMNRGLFATADYPTPLESVVDELAFPA